MSNAVAYSPDAPRYIWRELEGWDIALGGRRGYSSATFTVLDTWNGFAVVVQRTSGANGGLSNTRPGPRKRFAAYVDRPNSPPLCAHCGKALPVTFITPRDTPHYCGTACADAARWLRRKASR